MTPQGDPAVVSELMEWCLGRAADGAARRQRVTRLFHEFGPLVDGKVPIVTVAGTSGKGSTCALLEAVLAEAGHVTGVYTKPHLVSFRERFRVAGLDVTDAELASHTRPVYERLRAFVARHGPAYHPSLYEALILIAASLFAERGVTFAVFEASVGGASCATSYLPSVLSILTSVDLDHERELGPRLEDIARDKAGIVRPGGVLVVGAGVADGVGSVVRAECTARNVRYVQADDVGVGDPAAGAAGQTVRFDHEGVERSVFVPFPGRHQARNVATVWAATRLLHVTGHVRSLDAIRGVGRARAPGRFEYVRGEPSWLLDVAHNPASIASLIETITEVLPGERFVTVVGATERHDHRAIVNLLGRWGVPLGFCQGFPRAVPARQLLDGAVTRGDLLGLFDSPAEAVGHCLTAPSLAGSTVLITGSLFLVGACRHELTRRGVIGQGVS